MLSQHFRLIVLGELALDAGFDDSFYVYFIELPDESLDKAVCRDMFLFFVTL